MTRSTTQQDAQHSNDPLDQWLSKAFDNAAEELPAADFIRRIELVEDKANNITRRVVLFGALLVAAALSSLQFESVSGLLDFIALGRESMHAVSDQIASAANVAAISSPQSERVLPAPGSLQGIAALLLLALTASWLSESAAQ
ncbi:MAG: hypothetical protein NXH85_09925 [Pseudomonadaceae bacterium]|nr:hypothetical protein [Pseudomonadaceae bacterium]